MKSIEEIQHEIIDEFAILGSDMESIIFYIMELGQKLEPLNDSFKADQNLVKGCQSKVWLHTELNGERIHFFGDSNTEITKGLVSMLIRIVSDQTADDILNADLFFMEKIGMNRFIGTQRSNGFAAMIKQIKLYALAYKSKVESQA